MMESEFAVGSTVTWGGGSIRAKVLACAAVDDRPVLTVEILNDYHAPCGDVIPAGQRIRFFLDEVQPRGVN